VVVLPLFLSRATGDQDKSDKASARNIYASILLVASDQYTEEITAAWAVSNAAIIIDYAGLPPGSVSFKKGYVAITSEEQMEDGAENTVVIYDDGRIPAEDEEASEDGAADGVFVQYGTRKSNYFPEIQN
jgi:hypothetical protein